MAIAITHAKVVSRPDDPNYDVSKDEWNDNHVVTGVAASGDNSDLTGLSALVGTTSKAPISFLNGVLKPSPVAGDFEYADGHFYITNGARHSVSNSAGIKVSSTTVTNTVTETSLYTYTFSANELHVDERVQFDISGSISNVAASDDYTIRVYVGGTLIATLPRVGAASNVTNVGWDLKYIGTIRLEGASGTFVDHGVLTEGTLVASHDDGSTHSVDTTSTIVFNVTVQWSTAKAGNVFTCTQGSIVFNH